MDWICFVLSLDVYVYMWEFSCRELVDGCLYKVYAYLV